MLHDVAGCRKWATEACELIRGERHEAIGAETPGDTNLSMRRSELLALRVEPQRIRQLYEARVRKLEPEQNQLSQTLSMLKYRAIKQPESIFEEERVS